MKNRCSYPGCKNNSVARKLCKNHYNQARNSRKLGNFPTAGKKAKPAATPRETQARYIKATAATVYLAVSTELLALACAEFRLGHDTVAQLLRQVGSNFHSRATGEE